MKSRVEKSIRQFFLRKKKDILYSQNLELDITFLWELAIIYDGKIDVAVKEFTDLFHYMFPTKKIVIEHSEHDVLTAQITAVSQGIDCPKDKAYQWIIKEIILKKRKHVYLAVLKKYYDALPSLYKTIKTLRDYVSDLFNWVKDTMENLEIEFTVRKKEVKIKSIILS